MLFRERLGTHRPVGARAGGHLPGLLALGLAGSVVLAGCGGAGGEETAAQPSGGSAAGGSLDAVCEAAAGEEQAALWYESSLPEQTDMIITAFNDTYPEVEVEHLRLAGGNAISAQIITESQAGARTADMATGTVDQVAELASRDLVQNLEKADLGITDEELLSVPYAVSTTTTFPVVVYNTDLVDDDEAPSTWKELVDPKWKGQMGGYTRDGLFFANLVPEWGEAETDAYVEKFAALHPVLAESTFALAQEIGAGARPIGLGIYHTAFDVQKTGAPIAIKVLDPAPLGPLYSVVTESSVSPQSAKCFVGWLATEEGAMAYEGATSRGNHLVPGTKTADLLEGVTTTTYLFNEVQKLAELGAKYDQVIGR